VGAIEGRKVQLVPVDLTGEVSMVSAVRQEGSGHDVIRLRKLADRRFLLTVVRRKGDRPTARYIGASAGGLRKKAIGLFELRA
jgi:hypothetical protein